MKTILAPIDFSESAKLVIDEAVTLARATNARLILLHVLEPVSGSSTEFGFAEAAARIAGDAANDAARRLSHIQRQLAARGVTAATCHTTGIPGAAIVARAQDFDASHIVIGSHGHGALYELLVGSTAHRVINEAPCPVVVVPSRARPTGDAPVFDLEPVGAFEASPPLAGPDQR